MSVRSCGIFPMIVILNPGAKPRQGPYEGYGSNPVARMVPCMPRRDRVNCSYNFDQRTVPRADLVAAQDDTMKRRAGCGRRGFHVAALCYPSRGASLTAEAAVPTWPLSHIAWGAV